MACQNHMLTFEEVSRLDKVLNEIIQVHGRGNFPTLEVKPRDFIKLLLSRLRKDGIKVKDVRLNGSTASYVLSTWTEEEDYTYNDLDVIFNVDLQSASHFQLVKVAVLDSLMDFMPADVSKERMRSCTLKEAYVRKMVKVVNKPDTWSLISLTNNEGRNIELKFVDTMRRQFEFSVDSFQVVLDSLLSFHDVSAMDMSAYFYPSVLAVSVYGDYEEALRHLKHRLIATLNPEEIRGGGLLKYCNLLVRDFTPVSEDFFNMERYMCSRFFIDFKDINTQEQKLLGYLNSHFPNDDSRKYYYLKTLYRVVGNSTICLMGHERRQTLRLIQSMADQICRPPTYQQITVFYSVPQYLQSTPPACINQQSQEYIMLGTWNSNKVSVAPTTTTTQQVKCH